MAPSIRARTPGACGCELIRKQCGRKRDGPKSGVEQPLQAGCPGSIERKIGQPEEVLEEFAADTSDREINLPISPITSELAGPMSGQHVGEAVRCLEQLPCNTVHIGCVVDRQVERTVEGTRHFDRDPDVARIGRA